jgi:hypothetical protein
MEFLSLYPWGYGLDTHWRGDPVVSRAGMDTVENRKYLVPVGNRNRFVHLVVSYL